MATLLTLTSKPEASDKDVPSPPYSSFSISTPSPTIYLPLCPPPRANARTSHHAYIDDILIRSDDVVYIQNSLNYFDGPARDWGLDMNVSKTEVHANGTAPQKEFLTPRGSELLTYNKKTGRPHTCYKYLGVYPFTCHQARGLFHMLKADIQSYFARLSPLPLTLSEKVRLTNSQLVPALAYRLITHSLSPHPAREGSVTHLGGSCVRRHHTSSLPQKTVSQLAKREGWE